MSVTDKLKKTKKKVEETAKKKAYAEKPGAKTQAKISNLVSMSPTKAVKGQGQTVTKSVPKAKNVTSQTQTRKQAIQKKWGQQEERARSIGLEHVLGRSPLYTLQRDNAIGRTVQDRLDFSKYLGTQPRELSDEEKREEVRERLNVIARQLKDAGQPLSSQDRKLSSRDQNLIRSAKTEYDEAREQGNRALMEAAHKRAESVRKMQGYSGGATGEDYISPKLSFYEKSKLNKEQETHLKRLKKNLEEAKKSGDETKIAQADAAIQRLLSGGRREKKESNVPTGPEDANGRKRENGQAISYEDWEKRAYEGVYSVMSAVPGSILSLVETSNQAIENDFREKNWDYINDKANRLQEYKTKLELAKKGEGDPEWGTVRQLEQQVRIAERAEKMRSAGTTVDPNLPGQTLMRKSMEAQQKFMEGRTGVDKLLASAALSMGQMAPALAASAIPGVGPAIGAGIMGAQAAGSKSYELNERGVDPAEAQLRGVTSGVIESLTEKVPISNLLKVVKAGGGASLLKTMAKQAGIEATEESISYALNYAADVAYKDPEARFSMNDLLESAAVGAISGGILSGGGSMLGRAMNRNAGTSGQVVTPVRQEQKETRADTERQIRDQAAAMLTGEAAVPETVRQTERTTQRDVPVAEILERAPVSGNVQREMRNEAKTASSSQKAVPAKTVNPTRIEVQGQDGSPVMEPNSKVRQVLGQAQTSMLTRMANTLGDSGSKAIMAAWDNNGNPGQYAADFVRVYNRSLSGTTVGRIQAPASLTDAQVMAAYTAGQNDRMASLEQEKVNAKQAEVAGRNTAVYATVDGSEAGLVYDDYVRDVMDRDTAESVTTVAKQLGLRVQMVDSVAGGMANADIQGSVVQIEKNNPNPVRSLFGHEMTHRVQQLAPESYRAFRDYVMQSEKAQADVQRKITEYKKAGVELSSEAAMDEIAADYAGEMIEDQNLLKRFIENNRSNQSLLHRFLTAVKDMARKLTGSYQKRANDAAALLEKAVEDASRKAGKLQANKNTARKGGVRYSIRKEFTSEVQEWYENGMQQDERFTLGSAGPVLQGLGAIESDIYMDGNKIKTIFEEHPEMGVREIKRIPEILEDPVLILKSRNVGRNPKGNNRLVLFGSIKAKDGRPIMCVLDLRPTENGFLLDDMQKVNSAYTKDVKPVEFIRASSVLHADKKRTIPLLRSIGFKMPIALLRDGSVGSIFYSGTNVNIHGVPFGEVVSENEKRFSLKSPVEETKDLLALHNLTDQNLLDALQATASKSYRNIPDIKKDSGRLGSVESEEYKVQMQAVDTEIKSVIQKVRKGNKPHSENTFEEEDIIGTILMDTAKGKKTVDAIVKSFAREDYKISTQTAKDIQALYKAAASLPTEYFEAKPQRAVGFNEVLAAVIPDNSSDTLRSGLNDAGVNVLEYKAGDDADRLDKVNSVENAKFSLKGSDDYQGLIEKYGAMEQGENPRARDVQVPSQTADGKKVSRTVRTVMEAAATPEDMVPTIQEMVEKGEFSYEVAGDKAAIHAAEATIREKGFQASLMDWTSELASGKISKQNVADGWALYNAAAQAGDTKTAADILTRIVQHQRNAAQAVQATRILKKMSPGAQLYGIQRSVQNMQAELQSKYGDKAPDLKIPDELVEQYLNADTKEARDEAEKEMYTAIGKQMPSTFKDKWNSWRYLAMLFNVRTHIRNVSGNAFFALPVMVKNFVGTGLEGVGSAVSGGKMQKTKGLYGPELFKAAWKDYQNAKPQIMAGGKYDDSVAKRDAIEDGRRIFQIKFLEGIRKFNSRALEVEDSWFAKPHYANALAQYCASNKITAEQIQTGDGLSQADLDKARAYAIQEAQKATYRDFNQFSDFISGLGRYSGDNTVKKAFSSMVEGVLPFRKTPANILVRAVEYSPAGLVSGIWELTYGVKTGKNTAAEALDRLSAGLTGSGLFALGVYLASQGLLIASGDDDDKQKDFDKLLGRQDYSIELRDGTNFTIDWLAPECIPVFMGAEYFKAMADREDTGAFSLTMFLDAMSKVTNPMLEMSCLSSLNDLFDNLSGFKSGDVSSLVVVAANMAVSYLTQGVPTLFGQGERASQEERMTTYTDKNKDLPPDWQYTLGKLSGRIPGWDYGQIPFIDAWGRTENEGSTADRLLNNFINPAYMSQYKVSKLEAELQRLYDATGESVLPQRADRSITVNGEDVYLTAEQYITYATQKGTRAQSLLQEIISSSWYADMDDAAKAKIITDALAVANEGAKLSVFPDYVSKNKAFLDASAMEGDGVPVGTFLMLSGIANAQEGVKNVDGVTISDSASYNKFKALIDSGVMDNLSAAQKEKVYDALEISSKVRSMNESALNQLGQDIETKKNEPSVFSILGEDKTDFVKEFYDTCDSFSSSYDGNGKPIKGQGKQDKIIAEINKYSNLTRKEKSALYHMFYESDRNNPWA